ncbi:iron-containing alcohol dehydrogenase [Acetobacterium woodii]|uniref:NADPH-dependent butanol dehydrogenase Bdh2 n=1 Tax=Acetobacterium woodii (strain ATCC 29683 / DSM 1030 / JCM 2381 / KCTC 1655 / WB1) TaxID=931626 RepID=H6LGG8_ACEWD|nr:iron-containing alcohol dehydrogenase [Acetobacterium woodii]AFA47104.1 NADPH-dependent butanol dehydrogenase Bdh2 [Acetobacterium woodii DSM 1030]
MSSLKFYGDEIITGPGTLKTIPDIVGQRVVIVTGKSALFKNGTINRIETLLQAQNKVYEIISGIGANPSVADVEAGLIKMNGFNPDTVIAIGGGSVLDAAKVMTLMCEYPELTITAIRNGKAPQKRERIKLIAVPSTSGTASEVTRAAVITFTRENIKIGLKTKAFIPDIAILDGELTLSMPQNVMADSGMDALTHGLEAYINKNADDFTKTMAKGAVVGLLKYLRQSFETGDLNSRQHVHNFQCLAGFAFQNAGLGMDHGIAHAFGGRFGTSHGLLNAIALPYVLEYNQSDPQVKADLAQLSREIGKDIIEEIKELNKTFKIPSSFQAAGIIESEFIENYDELLQNSLMGSTQRNPIKMEAAEMDQVLKNIYYGKN